MTKVFIILIIVIILGILGILYAIAYNHIQTLNIKVTEADNIINEHLKKRYDYVIRVSHLVKKNLDLDIDLFKEIENSKTNNISNIELDNKIQNAYNIILQLKEDYPQLNENRGFKDVLSDFNESNEIIEASKIFYDKYTTNLNEFLNKFPINIIGKIHQVSKRECYSSLKIEDSIIDK